MVASACSVSIEHPAAEPANESSARSAEDPGGGQRPDDEFTIDVRDPAYGFDTGPRVGIDAAHHNYHTVDGRYGGFAELLRRDGYRVAGFDQLFTVESLASIDLLVISNAIAAQNIEDWSLPNHSAFTTAEVAAVHDWVSRGGLLLLIADHMPMPGAAAALAAAFGVLFHDGYAYDGEGESHMTFRRETGGLADHAVTRGRNDDEIVPFVTSFTGQAFRALPGTDWVPLMRLDDAATMILPQRARESSGEDFPENTPRIPAGAMLQGALLRVGSGRAAVFGEAAMFTAQLSDESRRMGMNHPDAPHNAQFALNVLHWLTGLLEAD